jgi:hypothetical protein
MVLQKDSPKVLIFQQRFCLLFVQFKYPKFSSTYYYLASRKVNRRNFLFIIIIYSKEENDYKEGSFPFLIQMEVKVGDQLRMLPNTR